MAADCDTRAPARSTVGRERVEIDIGPGHLGRLDTIVDPLVVPDLTTMVWAPHGHEDGVEALRRLANIVLIDSQDLHEPAAAFARAEHLTASAYVVDLAWLRSTPWRERVAAAFDPPQLRRSLEEIDRVGVRHRDDSAAAGALFCGWLASRLGWRPSSLDRRGDRLHGHARARRHGGDDRPRAGRPGRARPGRRDAGDGLGRGAVARPGSGRAARRSARDPDGTERTWTVLGASRGEGGILGEGVRQALLRDPTYAPALQAARVMLG